MRMRTIEDITLSRGDESDTVIDGHSVYLSYRIRADVDAAIRTDDDVIIELACPCCDGMGHLSTMCSFGCDHELDCQTCEGEGWIPIRFEKGFDEDEDIFALDNEHFDDAELRVPLQVRRRFYFHAPIENRDDCGHYIDPNQESLFKESL
jgi:hypothetical protein